MYRTNGTMVLEEKHISLFREINCPFRRIRRKCNFRETKRNDTGLGSFDETSEKSSKM
jgi:hypothetical protein